MFPTVCISNLGPLPATIFCRWKMLEGCQIKVKPVAVSNRLWFARVCNLSHLANSALRPWRLKSSAENMFGVMTSSKPLARYLQSNLVECAVCGLGQVLQTVMLEVFEVNGNA